MCAKISLLRQNTLLAIVSLCFPLAATASDDSLAKYAAPYLLRGVGARPVAMGNAYIAESNDTQALYYNPAGLAFLKYTGIGSMISPQSQDQHLWSLEVSQPLGAYGGLGAGVIMNQIGDIEGRADEFSAPTNINSREGAFLLAYGYSPAPEWSVGVTAKYLFHRFDGLSDHGRGQAFDLGGKWVPQQVKDLVLAAVAQNIGGSFHWSTGRQDPVLFVFKLGASYRPTPWLLTVLDIDFRGDKAVRAHAGLEATHSLFAFRVGANHDRPTFGFGITSPKARLRLRFDYAFEFDPHGLEDVNRFSFSVRF